MNYDPFGISSNPMLQRGPTSFSFTPSLFGGAGQRRIGYGASGLSPVNFAASQKQEFSRLEGLQNLQTGALQQQQIGLDLRRSQMELADLEQQRRIRSILESGKPRDPMGYESGIYESAFRSSYGQQLRRQKEMEELELQRARMEAGVGGPVFTASMGGDSTSGMASMSPYGGSWSVPPFPMMGR